MPDLSIAAILAIDEFADAGVTLLIALDCGSSDHGQIAYAQALGMDGKLLDDFVILRHERVINVCNAPSPAATASLNIGKHIAEQAVGLS